MKFVALIICLAFATPILAQLSEVWVADQGDGTFRNPVLHADYSDPDAIRVGEDYYMIASSFEDVPGLPILHSKDLVNWSLIGHALQKLVPENHFSATRHGEGVWAPSIRYHNNEFYIYYPDPDFGIYLVKSKNIRGPWSTPLLVASGKGLIDPCPLWDDNGTAYLVHAFAGSRAGIKSVIVIREMNREGTKTLNEGVLVYDGHELDPTIEGPKLYKRDGYYYIFAPAGGVATGWQTVLRAKHIYGPYERKVVMDQGKSNVNGPHQGAWVTTTTGEDWFLHFQDMEAYGRVVHLQPMQWKEGWPVIGADSTNSGKGTPVMRFRKPKVGKTYPRQTSAESDEFNSTKLGLQWQWAGNPKPTWAFLNTASGSLRLFSQLMADTMHNLWDAPFVLQQKFPAAVFTAITKMQFSPNTKHLDEQAGIAVMGLNYASLGLRHTSEGISLVYALCKNADKAGREVLQQIPFTGNTVYLRVVVREGGHCEFSYSADGKTFTSVDKFTAVPGKWKGAKIGLFCTRGKVTNDAGYADFDWFRISR